jgi:hypothetical protein
METVTSRPVDELNQVALYRLLGQAWYDQCEPKAGEAYLILSTAKIGKREFDALLPMLREDLRQPHFYGVVACVAGTIRRYGAWPMPAEVVASLVVQLGFGLSDRIITQILSGEVQAVCSGDDTFMFVSRPNESSDSTDHAAASNHYCAQTLTNEFESTANVAGHGRRTTVAVGYDPKTSATLLMFKPQSTPFRRPSARTSVLSRS